MARSGSRFSWAAFGAGALLALALLGLLAYYYLYIRCGAAVAPWAGTNCPVPLP